MTIQVQPVPIEWPDKCTRVDEVERGLSTQNCHLSVGLGHVCLGEVFWCWELGARGADDEYSVYI